MTKGKTGTATITTGNFGAKIYWRDDYDVEGNYSVLTITGMDWTSFYAKGYWYPNGSISIDGEAILEMDYSASPTATHRFYASSAGKYGAVSTASGNAYGAFQTVSTGKIYHGTDGSKSVKLTLDAGCYNSSYGTLGFAGSVTIDLTTIPLASTIGATDANIGSVSMIAVTRKSSSYTHSIAYKFGDLTGYIKADGSTSDSEVKYSNTSVSFTVPDSFYAQIPKAKTGKCTLTCTTYKGSTQIGDAKTTTFTVTAAESLCKPTVSGTVVDSNSTTKALTGDETKLVRYKSVALCTISATANKSASISTKKIAGTAVSGNTLKISGIEKSSVSFQATDSRGYTTTKTVKFELIPYVVLTNNPVGKRTDPTSGNATLSISGNYYNGSFGAVNNTLTVRYRIAVQGGEYGDWIDAEYTLSGNTYSTEIALSGLDYESNFAVSVEVKDKIGKVTKTGTIKRGIPVFHWGEKSFAFQTLVDMKGNRISNLADPTADADAVSLKYLLNSSGLARKRNISVTANSTMAVGATFKVSESVLKEKPAFASLALTAAMGRVGGSTVSISFSNITSASNGLYLNYANFTVSDDGLTLTLASTKRVLLKADSVTVETGVSFNFGEVTLIG